MIVSTDFLGIMVSTALAITIAASIVIIILWLRDWRKGQLW